MKNKLAALLAVNVAIAETSMALESVDRRIRKPKPRKCRTLAQLKKRNKRRISNRSRAMNFKRAR